MSISNEQQMKICEIGKGKSLSKVLLMMEVTENIHQQKVIEQRIKLCGLKIGE